MSSTRIRRRIAADPTSVALLLADPATVELWPRLQRADGSRRDGAVGLLVIEVGSASGELRLLPPSRTPTAFVLRFDFDAATTGEPLRVEGRLELSWATPGNATPTTDALLELTTQRDLGHDAAEFLDRVAEAAERRARAA